MTKDLHIGYKQPPGMSRHGSSKGIVEVVVVVVVVVEVVVVDVVVVDSGSVVDVGPEVVLVVS